jgi:light-independent protochlorophyllide reductase subunit B
MGFEGANVIFDTWVHPLLMGLEEHLLTMFRDDFEFHDNAAPSHLSVGGTRAPDPAIAPAAPQPVVEAEGPARWDTEAERELLKIPFFVRGKARRNTERFAADRRLPTITLGTLYDAKAHYGR